jgi:hypothetical protein
MSEPFDDSPGAGRTRRVRAVTLLITIFVVGAASGYVAAVVMGGSRFGARPTTASVRARIHGGFPAAFDSLNLTAQQRDSITRLLDRARPKTDAALQEMIPRLRALTDSLDADIRAVLRPEQRDRLAAVRGPTQPLIVLKRTVPGRPVRVDTVYRNARP